MTAMPPLHIGEVNASFTKPISCAILRIKKSSLYTRGAEITYSAYGLPLSKTCSIADTLGTLNPFRYRGYIYDEETGLYYCNSRYYDPSVGRFLNSDTEEVVLASLETPHWDKNLYAYCDNNSVIREDSDGQWWHIVVCAAINGTVSAIITMADGGDFWDVTTSFLVGNITGALAAGGGVAGVIGASVISGAYTGVDAYYEGATVEASIACGVVSAAATASSVGSGLTFAEEFANITIEPIVSVLVAGTFDVGYTIAGSAITSGIAKTNSRYIWTFSRSPVTSTTTYYISSGYSPTTGVFDYVSTSAYTRRI